MKIRIKGNSLRYRLTKSELKKLVVDGLLEERSEFASKTLVYSIVITNDDKLIADYTDDRIILKMPRTMIDELDNSDKVGFAGQNNGTVSLLIEKDFTCLNPVEDQSDNFPNPLSASHRES